MSIGYTGKAADDYLGQTDTRDAATALIDLHRRMAREHDGIAGTHLGGHIRSSGGTVSEAATLYTLRDSYGLVASIAKIATGHIRVTLSGSGIALASGETVRWYPVDVLLHDAIGRVRVTARTATTFDVLLFDTSVAAQDTGFSFAVGGRAA